MNLFFIWPVEEPNFWRKWLVTSRKYARQVRNNLPDHKPSKLAQSTEAHEKNL